MQKTLLIASLVCLGLGLGTANKAHAAATGAVAESLPAIVDALSEIEAANPGSLRALDASGNANIIASRLKASDVDTILNTARDARAALASKNASKASQIVQDALFTGSVPKITLAATVVSKRRSSFAAATPAATSNVTNLATVQVGPLTTAWFNNLNAANRSDLVTALRQAEVNLKKRDARLDLQGKDQANLIKMDTALQIEMAQIVIQVVNNPLFQTASPSAINDLFVSALMTARNMKDTPENRQLAIRDANSLGLISQGAQCSTIANDDNCGHCQLVNTAVN
jgi:hypothetical protein